MVAATCPSREELFDYAVGRLPDGASQTVGEHVESCPACQAAFATFDDADDTLVARLRGPAVPDPYLEESQCDAALARAKGAGEPGEGSPAGEKGDSPRQMGTVPFFPLAELGEYRLLAELGHGGMGRVYKALHTKLDRVVALKVLPKGRGDDDRAIARFEREMKAIGRLDHPSIVRAYDAREIAGSPVLIMEYVEGLDLARLVRRLGPLPLADACELARQAAVGLQYIDEHGLVHRDIKPSNLMLTPQGVVKILDLGLARFHLEQAGEEMTGSNQAMGTADYMAPEQASDSHAVDIRADIYSLGCTLYKLLTGHAPFAGSQYRGTFEKMTAHVNQPVPPIRDYLPDLPAELAAILDRMLAKVPQSRHATPAEVAAALAPFCDGADLPRLVARAAEIETSESDEGRLAESPHRASRASASAPAPLSAARRRKLVVAAVGLLLLVLGFGFSLGILVTIKKDGKATTLDVPVGSALKIGRDGNVEVDLGDGAPAAPRTGPATSDLEAIQGTWEIVRCSKEPFAMQLFWSALIDPEGFKRLTPEEILKGTRLVITADALKVRGKHFSNISNRYQLNPTTKPKMIDVMIAKSPGLGVYEFEDGNLKVALDWSGRRPPAVWAELGSGQEFLLLRRVGKATSQPDETTIQGAWQIASAVGEIPLPPAPQTTPPSSPPVPAADALKGKAVLITRHSITVRSAVPMWTWTPGAGQDMADWEVGYGLDSTTKPKTIDLHAVLPFLGVYELQGDQLRICFGKARPSALSEKPGPEQMLIILRRGAIPAAAADRAPAPSMPLPAARVMIDIDKKAQIRLDGAEHDLPSLEARLRETARDNPLTEVYLRCDDGLSYAEANKFLQLLETAGIGRVYFQFLTPIPPVARLDFRVAINGLDEGPDIPRAEVQSLLEELKAHGPKQPPGQPPDAQGATDPFAVRPPVCAAWFRWPDPPSPAGKEQEGNVPGITAIHEGRRYILLSTDPKGTMLASDQGEREWGINFISTEFGKPVINLGFTEAGARRMAALSESNVGRPLAILVNDVVISVPVLRSKLSDKAQITGNFTDEEVERLVAAIQAGLEAKEK